MIQDLAPGTAQRMELGARQLVARYPRLIGCDVSGYGEGGPYSDKRAYDLLVQAEAASIATTGWPDRPAKPGIAIADLAAGLYTYIGGDAGQRPPHRPRSIGASAVVKAFIGDYLSGLNVHAVHPAAFVRGR